MHCFHVHETQNLLKLFAVYPKFQTIQYRFLDIVSAPGNLKKDAVEKCPDGFVRFQDSCYNFYSEKFSWPEALIFCRAFNYSLVTLTSIDQYSFIKSHLTTITGGYTSSGFWTAGTSADLQGHWKWVTNKQPIDFEQFNATDPTKSSFSGMISANQQSGCLALEKNTGFNVARVDCMTPQHFICERHDSQWKTSIFCFILFVRLMSNFAKRYFSEYVNDFFFFTCNHATLW